MNKVFEGFEGSMLMSLIFGLIDEKNGTMYYIGAEHPEIILYRYERAEFLMNKRQYKKLGTYEQQVNICVEVFSLKPNDIIILGSDGKDDIILGIDPENGSNIISEDEHLFLTHAKKGGGDLKNLRGNYHKRKTDG